MIIDQWQTCSVSVGWARDVHGKLKTSYPSSDNFMFNYWMWIISQWGCMVGQRWVELLQQRYVLISQKELWSPSPAADRPLIWLESQPSLFPGYLTNLIPTVPLSYWPPMTQIRGLANVEGGEHRQIRPSTKRPYHGNLSNRQQRSGLSLYPTPSTWYFSPVMIPVCSVQLCRSEPEVVPLVPQGCRAACGVSESLTFLLEWETIFGEIWFGEG
jgi:hypothetical protein